MTSFHRLVPAALLAIVAACSSGDSGVLSINSYDTSCQADSDCIAVVVGSLACCACPNAAINKADEAKYEADAAAAIAHTGVCNLECGACEATTTSCAKGTCAISFGPDGGPSDGGTIACGATTCTSAEVCVMDQFEGGAQMPPNDAGMCPSGDANDGGTCQPLPTYHCAPVPQACGTGLTCACSQPLCETGYTCQQASAGLVQCYLMAP